MTSGREAAAAGETATARPRIVVIDDSTVIRGGFATVHPELEVIATFATVEEFESASPACDVVVLDLLLRKPTSDAPSTMQGLAAIQAVRSRGHRVCLYTDERRAMVLALCLRAGADGVVHKSDPPHRAVRAIDNVRLGHVAITQSLVGLTELLDRRGAALQLSPRQRQVVSARARGRRWSDVAASLYISEDTAREHYRAACLKLSLYLQHASAGDIERALGFAPGDVLDDT